MNELESVFIQCNPETVHRPYEIYPKTYDIKCNIVIDNRWEETSKRRLNTDKILPKSKRNHSVIQPWQSSYKRWNRNPHIIERLLVKKASKQICDEIDKELMADVIRVFGTNNEI